MTARAPFIVGIGGTTRAGSSSEMALALALKHAAAAGARTEHVADNDAEDEHPDGQVEQHAGLHQ